MDKPVYEIENDLAESLGWTCIKDYHRHSGEDCSWARFHKDGTDVWSCYPIWCRRAGNDLSYHKSLEDALNNINATGKKFLLPDGRWETVS